MLLKMGWRGGGLGVAGIGVEIPIAVSTAHTGRMGLGGTLLFPELAPENQSFLQECEVCGGAVPKQIWDEHCAGKKHQRNVARAKGESATDKHVVPGKGDVVVQAAQRFCEAYKRAVPIKAWDMHCRGKKHVTKFARLNS